MVTGYMLYLSFIALTSAQWATVGTGVHYRDYGYGPGVLVTYAGWSVSDALTQHWAERLVQQRPHVPLLHNVGHVYAVRGPREVLYDSSEISNSKLIKHMLQLPLSRPGHVLVVAHSSGAYVAKEFFSQLHGPAGDKSGKFDNKLIYLNLDGGGGLDAVSKSKVKRYFVYAKSGSLYSMNANTMMTLGSPGTLIQIDGSHSGCFNSKCLHDFMINQHPWDPYGFVLEKDYGLFSLGKHEGESIAVKGLPPWRDHAEDTIPNSARLYRHQPNPSNFPILTP